MVILFAFSTWFIIFEYHCNVPVVSSGLQYPLIVANDDFIFEGVNLGDGVYSVTEQFVFFICMIIGMCCLSDCFEYWSKIK
jgi:hypothetical protein